nr:alpha/beta hydrolase [Tissierella sp.]
MQKKINIKNNYNKNLSVIIEVPKDNIKDFIIISHCFTCSKSYKLYNNISKLLVERGYGVVRYDAMGLGSSEGDFSKTSFSTNVEDLIAVYYYIAEKYKTPSYLLGHSIGSLVSIKTANILEGVKGVATVGSPSDFKNVVRLFSRYEDELIQNDNLVVKLAGRDINLGLEYLKDAREENMDEIIKQFTKPIIMFHSDSDSTVYYEDGLKLFDKISSEKSFITLKDVDHLASEKKDSIYIGEILCAWLENFDRK